MKEISFSWMTTAFLAGAKTVTRQDWKDSYAKTFKKGEIVAAYSKQRRFGGKKIGLIKLTQDPYKENVTDMPKEDWVAEGFALMVAEKKLMNGRTAWNFYKRWVGEEKDLWVVRFRVVEILG